MSDIWPGHTGHHTRPQLVQTKHVLRFTPSRACVRPTHQILMDFIRIVMSGGSQCQRLRTMLVFYVSRSGIQNRRNPPDGGSKKRRRENYGERARERGCARGEREKVIQYNTKRGLGVFGGWVSVIKGGVWCAATMSWQACAQSMVW